MDIRKIKKLIELLEESGIAEIEIKEGEEAVRISRMPPAGSAPAYPQFMASMPMAMSPQLEGCRRAGGGSVRHQAEAQ
jgi:acetyl-CoA carboxylase biotin carboxyl carrier protein